jgi:hypothetical protein
MTSKFKRKPAFLLIGDSNLVLIRKAAFHFKNGKREEGFAELDQILNKEARNSKGFRGFVSMLSKDSENEALIMTFWEDELSLTMSEGQILAPAIRKILNKLEKEPNVEHFKLYSTEMYTRRPI